MVTADLRAGRAHLLSTFCALSPWFLTDDLEDQHNISSHIMPSFQIAHMQSTLPSQQMEVINFLAGVTALAFIGPRELFPLLWLLFWLWYSVIRPCVMNSYKLMDYLFLSPLKHGKVPTTHVAPITVLLTKSFGLFVVSSHNALMIFSWIPIPYNPIETKVMNTCTISNIAHLLKGTHINQFKYHFQILNKHEFDCFSKCYWNTYSTGTCNGMFTKWYFSSRGHGLVNKPHSITIYLVYFKGNF